MIRNYLKTVTRNLQKDKLYSVINIMGLAVGLAAIMMITLFVRQELAFDSFWPDRDRLYRVEKVLYLPGRPELPGVTTQGPLKAALEADFPEMEAVSRIIFPDVEFKFGQFKDFETIGVADSNFFDILQLKFVDGNRETALGDPTSVVLSRSLAIKYFGTEYAVGQTISINTNDFFDYRVTGVFEDVPAASHLPLEAVIPIDLVGERTPGLALDRWFSTNFYTYVRLRPGVDPESFSERLRIVADGHTEGIAGRNASDFINFFLTAIDDIHLQSPQRNMLKPPGDINALLGLTGIALLITIIAGINFVNLATARATMREREVALRKVVGASRSQITLQFLGEAVQTTLIAGLLALGLVELTVPAFNGLFNTEIQAAFFDDLPFFAGMAMGTLVFGLVTGIYPAIYQSSARPGRVLAAQNSAGSASGRVRAALVLLQFAITIILIVATVTVTQQIRYASAGDPSFDSSNMLLVRGFQTDSAQGQAQEFLEEARKLPGVISAGWSSLVPGDGDDNGRLARQMNQTVNNAIRLTLVRTGPGFFPTYGIHPLAGRLFDKNRSVDIAPVDGEERVPNIILNETAARVMGFENAEEAAGATIWMGGEDMRQALVIGVVPDLRIRSARLTARPLVFTVDPRFFRTASIRFRSGDEAALFSSIDSLWDKLVPGVPIRRLRLKDNLNQLYTTDARNARLLTTFAGLALLLSCLGLFGISAFAVARRTKEIGIRKVLGAEISDIVKLLTWQFSKPVMVANLIAWPVAWFVMRNWLDGFSYRIDLNPIWFVGAGFLALVIAWLTVGGHALRAARANPINALRYE